MRKIRKYCQLNEKENKAYKNLWDATKAGGKGKYIACNYQQTYFLYVSFIMILALTSNIIFNSISNSGIFMLFLILEDMHLSSFIKYSISGFVT